MTAGQLPALVPLSEKAWQEQVTQLAEMLGWDWAHWRAARTAHGWRTPVSGTMGEGFPDLILVRERDRRLLLVELKSDVGRLLPAQTAVHAMLRAAGVDVHVWRPRDWDEVVATLQVPNKPVVGRHEPIGKSVAVTRGGQIASSTRRRLSYGSGDGSDLPVEENPWT